MLEKKTYSTRKVIFLDIDGVLATERTEKADKKFWYNEKAYPFERKCVKVLNLIIEKREPEIVLTSDWRRMFSIEEMGKIFEFNGLISKPVDFTEVLHNRDKEIKKYVEEKKLSKFVIIDDTNITCFNERFIQTKAEIGLELKDSKQIIKLLK